MQTLYLVMVLILLIIASVWFAVLDKGSAQFSPCPIGQAPVVGADGKQLIDASGTPQCSPIDAFNNLFGK